MSANGISQPRKMIFVLKQGPVCLEDPVMADIDSIPLNIITHLPLVPGVGGAVRFLVVGTIGQGERPPRVSSGWSSIWHCSNTVLSSSQYEQIPIILGVWPFCLTPFFFSVNNILAGLWLNYISSVEITLFLLADILLQHRALFQC